MCEDIIKAISATTKYNLEVLRVKDGMNLKWLPKLNQEVGSRDKME